MKKCGKCFKTKELSEFYHHKNRPRHWCKKCDLINTLIRQRIFKEKCIKYKGGKCEICGYDKYIGAFDFHHINPEEKEFGIASAKQRKFDQKVKDELDKCQLLCANCHREEHQKYSDQELNGLWDWYQERREAAKLISKEELAKKRRCSCGRNKADKAKTCIKCKEKTNKTYGLNINQVLDRLKINDYNWCKTAREFNLSDNGLRKFVKSKGYNLKELK